MRALLGIFATIALLSFENHALARGLVQFTIMPEPCNQNSFFPGSFSNVKVSPSRGF